ncbi:MAG: YigZ family protein [Eubacteriales bacterium]|nr:YigZ family protein [Eubacteriales bacterium]
MSDRGYISLKNKAFTELTEKKSVFYCTVSPVSTEEAASEFINSVKKKYSDATHNVYAYIIRESNITRFSDDGEPHGTAGIPVLDVLRKEGITDAAAVVTRYFGGTLLGAGGLVRAYTASAKSAVEKAGTVMWVRFASFYVKASYADYQKLTYLFKTSGVTVKNVEYAETVTAECRIEEEQFISIKADISETTNGKAELSQSEIRFLPKEKEFLPYENI